MWGGGYGEFGKDNGGLAALGRLLNGFKNTRARRFWVGGFADGCFSSLPMSTSDDLNFAVLVGIFTQRLPCETP